MKRRWPIPPVLIPLALIALTAPALAAPTAIAVHDGWGAFRDGVRCYAIAEADASPFMQELEPYAAVSLAPDAPAVQLRLSRVVRDGSAVTLRVGTRRFQLNAEGATATGRDVAEGGNAAIMAAMREADDMAVYGRDRRSRSFADRYTLKGAPSAIDAALIGCAR